MENDLKRLHDLCQNYTILYVEDDKQTQEAVAKTLGRFFKEIYTADDGFMGLELFREHRPDIVITDIQMPYVNGIEMSKNHQNTLPKNTYYYHHGVQRRRLFS